MIERDTQQSAASRQHPAHMDASRPRRVGRTQRFIAPCALADEETLCLAPPGVLLQDGPGPDDSYAAVIEVDSVNFALRSDEERAAIIAGYCGFLNALTRDVQVLVRILPLALDTYIEHLWQSYRSSALTLSHETGRSLSSLLAPALENEHQENEGDAPWSGRGRDETGRWPYDTYDAHDAHDNPDAQHYHRTRPISQVIPAITLQQRQRPTDTAQVGSRAPSLGAARTGALARGPAVFAQAQGVQRVAWERLITEHLSFVQELAQKRRLLDRHFYLIVPAKPPTLPRGWKEMRAAMGRRLAILRGQPPATPLEDAIRIWQSQSAARDDLSMACTEIIRQLGRMGLHGKRLGGLDLLTLYRECLAPGAPIREAAAGLGLPPTASMSEPHALFSLPALPLVTESVAAPSDDTAAAASPAASSHSSDAGSRRDDQWNGMHGMDGMGGAVADQFGEVGPQRVTPVNVVDMPPWWHRSSLSVGAAQRPASSPASIPVPSALTEDAGVPQQAAKQVATKPATKSATKAGKKAAKRSRQEVAPPLFAGIADVLAPDEVILAKDHLVVDDQWIRGLFVQDYPRHVWPGWLARLIDADVPVDIAVHVHPQRPERVVRSLNRKLVQFASARALDEKAGKLRDSERDTAYRDVEHLRDQLVRGDTRVFDFALYLSVRGDSQDHLDERTRQLQLQLEELLLGARPARLEQDYALISMLPQARDTLRRTTLLDTMSVATAFPFSSSTLSMQEGILFGTVPRNGALIILDPFSAELENANQVVFAKSGSGKSYAMKLQIIRSLYAGTAVCIIDPEDEYRRMCEAVGGQYVRLAPGSAQRINPFDLVVGQVSAGADVLDGDAIGKVDAVSADDRVATAASALASAPSRPSPMPTLAPQPVVLQADQLAQKVQSLHTLYDLMLADNGPERSGTLSQREKGLLDRVTYATYRAKGITGDPATHRLPAPLLADLYTTLTSDEFRRQDTTGLAERLRRYVDGSLAQLFSSPTNVDLENPCTVFNIRDLDAELKPLGLYMISEFVWTRMRREREHPRPRALLIDEAWTLMQRSEGGRFLASLARRARKYYLAVWTITQDVEDFLGSEWGRTVLAQSSIKLLMKQDATTIDPVAQAFHLSQSERQFLLGCNIGEGMLFARGAHVGMRIEASPLEHTLATTNPRELTDTWGGNAIRVARNSTAHPAHAQRSQRYPAPDGTHYARAQLRSSGPFDDRVVDSPSAPDSHADRRDHRDRSDRTRETHP